MQERNDAPGAFHRDNTALPQPGEGLHGEKLGTQSNVKPTPTTESVEEQLPYPSPLQNLPTRISHSELARKGGNS